MANRECFSLTCSEPAEPGRWECRDCRRRLEDAAAEAKKRAESAAKGEKNAKR